MKKEQSIKLSSILKLLVVLCCLYGVMCLGEKREEARFHRFTVNIKAFNDSRLNERALKERTMGVTALLANRLRDSINGKF